MQCGRVRPSRCCAQSEPQNKDTADAFFTPAAGVQQWRRIRPLPIERPGGWQSQRSEPQAETRWGRDKPAIFLVLAVIGMPLSARTTDSTQNGSGCWGQNTHVGRPCKRQIRQSERGRVIVELRKGQSRGTGALYAGHQANAQREKRTCPVTDVGWSSARTTNTMVVRVLLFRRLICGARKLDYL